MGLFGKKKKEDTKLSAEIKMDNLNDLEDMEEGKGGGYVSSMSSSTNSELQDLLNEFREMRSNITQSNNAEASTDANTDANAEASEEPEEEIIEDESVDEGEEYDVDEDESASIENFLTGKETEEPEDEIVEEETVEEEPEEEIVDEPVEKAEDENPVDVEVSISDAPSEVVEEESLASEDDLAPEEVVEDEPVEEQSEEPVEDVEEPEPVAEPVELPKNVITSEELEKKFNEFENRLLNVISMQLANGVTPNNEPASKPVVVEPERRSEDDSAELNISYDGGKLVINGFKFDGEVVMFTPLDSIKPATWEEVVRRKGHCTYHLTTSGNGGWFIKKSNAPNPYAYIEKKEDAEELAKIYARREKAELKIHNAKGVIEKSLSFGREKLRG